MTDANRCLLGTEEQITVSSVLRTFPEDVLALLEGRQTTSGVQLPIAYALADDGRLLPSESRRQPTTERP